MKILCMSAFIVLLLLTGCKKKERPVEVETPKKETVIEKKEQVDTSLGRVIKMTRQDDVCFFELENGVAYVGGNCPILFNGETATQRFDDGRLYLCLDKAEMCYSVR